MKEGSSANAFLQIIKKQGYNKDCYLHVGIVNGSKIKIDELEIDSDDYLRCEKVNTLKSGDKVLVIQDGTCFYVIDRVVT